MAVKAHSDIKRTITAAVITIRDSSTECGRADGHSNINTKDTNTGSSINCDEGGEKQKA